ncbi:unnamed protein product [Blepharisma stoltei]|uniref:Uncharacterized protein n=1 Tax=Blepharisma stoltei TaxID=1481888 RepID=A0AAU9JLE7_9CILI|nr:unnamed protein product [Blepharisma stoltei]
MKAKLHSVDKNLIAKQKYQQPGQRKIKPQENAQALELDQFLSTRLSYSLTEANLNLSHVGIQLYDPFTIVDSTPRFRTFLNSKMISLSSKSTKNLMKRDPSQVLRAKSYRLLPTEIEIDDNDTRHYVFYDDLSRSRSKKKLSPLNMKRSKSPYAANWTIKIKDASSLHGTKKRSASFRTPTGNRSMKKIGILRSSSTGKRTKPQSPNKSCA